MSTNKHAQIRYRALDKCFSNFGRKFFIDDLIEACSKAIYEYTGIENGIQRRQIFDDITYMESEEGWSIPLQRLKDGKKTYYRYEDSRYSINQQQLSPTELEQLKDTIYMLNRFNGMPQFDWMQEVLARFESSFNLKGDVSNVVTFDQNPDLKGLNYFSDLFNAIINKQVLRIKYKRFSKPTIDMVIHPYHLKQYNNRWFLLGYNPDMAKKIPVMNLPLDRIEEFSTINENYIENKEMDFLDFFYDVVGVTVYQDKPIEKVVLKIDAFTYNYIETKPLHASQKIKERTDTYTIIELNIILNYEFETILLGFADRIEIIEPLSLKEAIKKRADSIIKKNL